MAKRSNTTSIPYAGKEKNILAAAMETESPLYYGTGTADHADHFQICSNVWNSDRI